MENQTQFVPCEICGLLECWHLDPDGNETTEAKADTNERIRELSCWDADYVHTENCDCIVCLKRGEIDWTQCNLDSHTTAYMKSREDFIRDMEREPDCLEDYKAIIRRAEKIRQGQL